MPNIIPIQSIDQSELAVYTKLTENQLRNRMEPEKGLFIAQTSKVIEYALQSGYKPVSILAEEYQAEHQAKDILNQVGDIPVYTAKQEILQQITGYPLTRGILCAMRRPTLPSVEDICANAQRIAVLDGVVDATNVGAIVRSAAALNMDAVLITSTCCDPLNRRAVRVSMGTIFQIPWTIAEARTDGSEQPWIQTLRRFNFKTVAMALRDNSVSLEDPALLAEPKLAVILGAEGWGLASDTISSCDYTVCIPMSHGVDSLNVAAASAVAFWQLGKRP